MVNKSGGEPAAEAGGLDPKELIGALSRTLRVGAIQEAVDAAGKREKRRRRSLPSELVAALGQISEQPKKTSWREGRPYLAAAISLAAMVPAVGAAAAARPAPNPLPMAVLFGGSLWIGFEAWKAVGRNPRASRFAKAGVSAGVAFVAMQALFFAMMGLWMGPFGMRF